MHVCDGGGSTEKADLENDKFTTVDDDDHDVDDEVEEREMPVRPVEAGPRGVDLSGEAILLRACTFPPLMRKSLRHLKTSSFHTKLTHFD